MLVFGELLQASTRRLSKRVEILRPLIGSLSLRLPQLDISPLTLKLLKLRVEGQKLLFHSSLSGLPSEALPGHLLRSDTRHEVDGVVLLGNLLV